MHKTKICVMQVMVWSSGSETLTFKI